MKLNYGFYKWLRPSYVNFSYKISHVNCSYLSCRGKKSCSLLNKSHIRFTPLIHNHQNCWLLTYTEENLQDQHSTIKMSARNYATNNPIGEPIGHTSHSNRRSIQTPQTITFNHQSQHNVTSNYRMWEPINSGADTFNGRTTTFKIISYNVLSQYLLRSHQYLYKKCSRKDLRWDVRSKRLFDEILDYDPDIICLQEVDNLHIRTIFSMFQDIGYSGVSKRRTGDRRDGCAIYYKRSKFHFHATTSVEYKKPSVRFLNSDNVGVAVRLSPRDDCSTNPSANSFIVATTHLLYNPRRNDIRVAQLELFLAEIDRFAFFHMGTKSGHFPIILTGDFNSTPDSAPVQLVSNGIISKNSIKYHINLQSLNITDKCQHLDVYYRRLVYLNAVFKNHADGRPPRMLRYEHDENFSNHMLTHGLGLQSVYNHAKIDGQREATTFHRGWITVDYIYFSRCSSLRLSSRLRLPTQAECRRNGALPNRQNGSDHFALGAVFEFRFNQIFN